MHIPLWFALWLCCYVAASAQAQQDFNVTSRDPRISYVGQWVDQDNGGHKFTGSVGSSFSFTFQGTAVYWHATADPNGGVASAVVYDDQTSYSNPIKSAIVDASSGTTRDSNPVLTTLFSATGLSPSRHSTLNVSYIGPGSLGGPYVEIYTIEYDGVQSAAPTGTSSSQGSSGSQSSNSSSSASHKSVNIGAIVGGVVGGVLGAVVLALLLVYLLRRYRRPVPLTPGMVTPFEPKPSLEAADARPIHRIPALIPQDPYPSALPSFQRDQVFDTGGGSVSGSTRSQPWSEDPSTLYQSPTNGPVPPRTDWHSSRSTGPSFDHAASPPPPY